MQELEKIIKKYPFANVIMTIAKTKDKQGNFKNRWLWTKGTEYFDMISERLQRLGINLDGKHATVTSKGLTFDYVIYKNRLLHNYPNAIIDLDLKFKEDKFSIKKENGKVVYSHEIANPYAKNLDDLEGAYCIVKIPGRGEFQTTMGINELNKHKNLSNMKYLYNDWWQELYKKTVLRKNLKFHFEDEFEDIQEVDDEGMDNELTKQPISHDEIKEAINKAETKDELLTVWAKLSGQQQVEFKELFTLKSKEI